MTINFKRLRTIPALLLLLIFSCRSTDTDNNLIGGGPAAIKINFGGEVYDEDSKDSKAAINSMEVQKTTVMVDPSTYVNIEVAPDNSVKTRAVKAPLDQALLRVMAYEKETQKYKAHQDYVIINGTPTTNETLVLDAGVNYVIVAYSFGSSETLPAVNTSEYLFQVKLNYNYTNSKTRDFMYFQDLDYTPAYGDNTLNILLKHKVAQLTAKLNTSGALIQGVRDLFITPNEKYGDIYIINGNISDRKTSVGEMNDINYTGLNSAEIVSSPILINANTEGKKEGKFGAKITIGGTEKAITTEPFFSITPGKKKNLNIAINVTAQKCGAFLGLNNTLWTEFMCHNLGADINADPFTPEAAIHGAKYQWGIKNPALTQDQDQSTSGAIVGWNNTLAPDNSWTDTGKTTNDPCPTGYKIPSSDQWLRVVNNNTVSRIGNDWTSGIGNYANAIKFGDGLVLPTAGFRSDDNGELSTRGWSGRYWSSTNSSSANAYYLFFRDISAVVINTYRSSGLSVRCIKE
ncbi:Fibrobacter succinogenes major domain (Fib_succ_major) [Elizabethkingia miricola]|nr:Fibrobacter succinogenes major domain (Fib_succ_major) [Elizabethkingia miricola]